jgi:hypothetical protein
MHLARRDEGALTSALQRCLARRTPSLKCELDPIARRFFELGFFGLVEVVALEAVPSDSRKWVRTVSDNDAVRTTQPSLMSTCA